MIKIHLVDGDPVARLECDKCRASMLAFIVLEKPHKLPTEAQRRTLRNLAQKAGWTHVLASAMDDGPTDLCPKCYTLPPEG